MPIFGFGSKDKPDDEGFVRGSSREIKGYNKGDKDIQYHKVVGWTDNNKPGKDKKMLPGEGTFVLKTNGNGYPIDYYWFGPGKAVGVSYGNIEQIKDEIAGKLFNGDVFYSSTPPSEYTMTTPALRIMYLEEDQTTKSIKWKPTKLSDDDFNIIKDALDDLFINKRKGLGKEVFGEVEIKSGRQVFSTSNSRTQRAFRYYGHNDDGDKPFPEGTVYPEKLLKFFEEMPIEKFTMSKDFIGWKILEVSREILFPDLYAQKQRQKNAIAANANGVAALKNPIVKDLTDKITTLTGFKNELSQQKRLTDTESYISNIRTTLKQWGEEAGASLQSSSTMGGSRRQRKPRRRITRRRRSTLKKNRR